MVAPAKSDYIHYLDGILESLNTFDKLDFIMLQEVDTASARSYYTNQYREISNILGSFNSIFVKNYDVYYVPLPIFNPMSRVVSGLSFFSAYPYSGASLIVFPDNYSWPKSLFLPDRCFLLISYDLDNGKKLHIINTHNSAFDDGSLRYAQLELLFDHMNTLYENGDYVIAGGDWNINPPAYKNLPFASEDIPFSVAFSSDIFKANSTWSVNFDPDYPTNRDVSTPYDPGLSPTTILDFFVCSPNISILEATTLYDGFQFTDHQPVYLEFELK
jgi:endonuclease/exonuclease/phosphatase family metal-dependent hydrolase